jgi:hypothetical protein
MLFNIALALIAWFAGSTVAAPHGMDTSLMVCASFAHLGLGSPYWL